ncbi:SPOR domain-containing protein [Moritella sp. 24]|uniref:SPOR domain-containing protein n=1 Tax=Moritella sp. 24 TaxID=2746230 RepID=UPI001BA4DED5|nr:SPOR domain-containing protein [Moritella sp. 24]QUM78167.1 SPOR domain-containing protein [Moritella sp. 24]
MHYSVQTEIYSQTQLCERLRHLTQFSSHLLLVSGESGSGKSTVLRNYVESDFNQKTITLDAQQCHDDSAIRTQILQQISYDGRFNAHIALIDSLPLLAQQLEHELTVCIDNAMTLSSACITEFAQLVELSLNKRINIKVNIILFAESKWVDITMLQFAKSATNVLELEMTVLDPQAAAKFVEQQFSQANYKPTFINQDAINRQIEACKGNPAELTKCARAIMQGQVYAPDSQHSETGKSAIAPNKSFYLAAVIASVLLLGSAGSFLYDAYQTEQDAVVIEQDFFEEPEISNDDVTVEATPIVDMTEPQTLASDWDDELPTEIGNTITLTDPVVSEPISSTQKQRVVIDDAAVNKMIAKQVTLDSAPVIDSKTVVENAKLPSIEETDSVDQTLADHAWVMAQPAKNYTFQIAGLSRESQLKQYLNENKLAENIWTYQTTRNNKPWYVVLYGSFTSVEQANAAKQKLPATVQKDKPWLKRFAQIQRDL